MKQLALLLMAASLTLPAQEAKAPAPARPAGANHIQRVYQVQHADVDELFRLVYTNAGNNQPTPVLRSSAALKAITVYGTPSEVDTIMASLKALDVPGRAAPIAGRNTFELTCYILLAAPEGEVEGSPLPDVLKGLATELERTFGLSQIRMIEAAVLRVGPRAANDLVGSLGPIGTYHFSVREAFREGTLARLGSVSLRLDMVGKKQINIISSADMEPGKLVVVGKAAVAGSKLSVIQVLSARMD